MSRFIETIRFEEGHYHLLAYHQRRIERTYATFYSGKCHIELTSILSDFRSEETHKFTITYDRQVSAVEHVAYVPLKIESLQLVTADPDYEFKYKDRSALNELRAQSQADEVIIVREGMITDTSFSNLAFYDGRKWLTPEHPLLCGVRREKLLEEEKIYECEILETEVQRFQKFCLINAMLDLGAMELPISAIVS